MNRKIIVKCFLGLVLWVGAPVWSPALGGDLMHAFVKLKLLPSVINFNGQLLRHVDVHWIVCVCKFIFLWNGIEWLNLAQIGL